MAPAGKYAHFTKDACENQQEHVPGGGPAAAVFDGTPFITVPQAITTHWPKRWLTGNPLASLSGPPIYPADEKTEAPRGKEPFQSCANTQGQSLGC